MARKPEKKPEKEKPQKKKKILASEAATKTDRHLF
jgi:hypothetical protein